MRTAACASGSAPGFHYGDGAIDAASPANIGNTERLHKFWQIFRAINRLAIQDLAMQARIIEAHLHFRAVDHRLRQLPPVVPAP